MKKNNKGFSLIELSIVLIIMGLLVAGVTGGASLIKSAQLRSVVNEFTNLRTAYNTYYAQFGKVPNAKADNPNVIDSATSSALQVLLDENIIDKQVTNGAISSKFGRGSLWFMLNSESGSDKLGGIVTKFANLNVILLSGSIDAKKGTLLNQEAANIDEKVDDGKPDSGLVIALEPGASPTKPPVIINQYSTTDLSRNISLISKLDF